MNEKSRLIIQGIKLNKESQTLFNKGKYKEAIELRNSSNRLLEGFNQDEVHAHFQLFTTTKRKK